MQQLQPLRPSKRKKPVSLTRTGVLALAAVCAAAAVGAGPDEARAVVVGPTAPPASPANAPRASADPNATVLPLNSALYFVLDGTISSHSKAGSLVRAHLRDPIMLAGKTIAPAGTPVSIEVTESAAAQVGNVDGNVEIFFQPLDIPGSKTLPLMTPTEHIDPHVSSGQQSTRDITDTVGDIFIPGHFLYHMLRKGGDVTLRAGTVIRARTAATLSIQRGEVVVTAPPAFAPELDTPAPSFSTEPIFTPPGFHQPTPKPSPSVQPTHTP